MRLRVTAIVIAMLSIAAPARAQDPSQHQHSQVSCRPEHPWSLEGAAFGGYNYQYRKFTDFDEVESQNWLMATGMKQFSCMTQLDVIGMFSLEPFTVRKIGSPQVFQTGETFQGAPLIDYQHPHDLIMNLGLQYTTMIGETTVKLGGYVVGPAPLGPPVFMHRQSAILNPQAPLSHHYLDATHVTPGVISIGVERSHIGVEVGAFHGQEPDEDRLDLDTAALDSYSARVSWKNGPWYVQFSGADLKTPERKSPYDATRITASASYYKPFIDFRGRETWSVAWTAAFGQNREVFGNLEAYLVEASLHGVWTGKDSVYARAEHVAKDILDAGFHPIGVAHTHRQSVISAFTFGYLRDIVSRSSGTFAIGADVSGYRVPENLKESYGRPFSFHAFLRFSGHAGTTHMDHRY